jgi:hypothetical protein
MTMAGKPAVSIVGSFLMSAESVIVTVGKYLITGSGAAPCTVSTGLSG